MLLFFPLFCFVLVFFSGASCWWLDRKELFIVLLKKVRSEEKGRAINIQLYRDEVVRQLASFNDCFRFISVSLFEGQVAGGLVNFKKT